MTGYQEILTDPSYAGQIVTLTYPHIGNTGVNPEDVESRACLRRRPGHPRPAARGLELAQHTETCPRTCATTGIVGIADIDTRKLTRILREKGAQNGCTRWRAMVDENERARRARAPRRRWPGSTSPRS